MYILQKNNWKINFYSAYMAISEDIKLLAINLIKDM